MLLDTFVRCCLIHNSKQLTYVLYCQIVGQPLLHTDTIEVRLALQ